MKNHSQPYFHIIRILLIFILSLNKLYSIRGQDVYYHVTNREIYDFLDELANEKIINLNSGIKPYSREFIAEQLILASGNSEDLTRRQNAELDFYLKDFRKELDTIFDTKKRLDLLYRRDSLFTLSINPILGIQYWQHENGRNYHRWVGAEAFGYIGKHFGVYVSLRDNYEDNVISDTGYYNMRYGAVYKAVHDYSEMRGGLTWKWKWGTIGIVKDHIEWGNTYHYPNIVSSKAPSFAQIKFNLRPVKWFEFNYFHGWLVSSVIDSSRSYNYNGVQRNVFHGKYMAANMYTFIPWQGLNLSFGNSIVYSDIGVHPAYLVPFFFYKSVDHTYNDTRNNTGQNSQLFFDISCRLIPKIHFYYSMYLDDLSFYRMFDPEEQSNHWSMKGGIRISNVAPNLILTAEYTRTNPLTYQNDNTTTFYNSNWYNLGHYLKDNADVLYVAASYKPIRAMHISVYYEKLRKGPGYPYDRSRDPETGIPGVHGKIFMEEVLWEQQRYGMLVNYQLVNDLHLFADIQRKTTNGDEERYTAPFFIGNLWIVSAGVNFGF
jgi:hypothetical protein